MSSRNLETLLAALESTDLPHDTEIDRHVQGLKDRLRLLTDYPAALGSLEAEHRFAEQYERRSGILRSAGLTKGINGQALVYPSAADLHARMVERPELLGKMRQGFTRVQPVPFGAPFEAFLPPLKEALRKYHKDGTLRATDGTKLDLNTAAPLWTWDGYADADRNGSLV